MAKKNSKAKSSSTKKSKAGIPVEKTNPAKPRARRTTRQRADERPVDWSNADNFVDFSRSDAKAAKLATAKFNKIFENKRPNWLSRIELEEKRRHLELLAQRQHATDTLENCRQQLLEDMPELTGIHIDYRRTNGEVVLPLENCIRLNVRKKLPLGHPRILNPAPKTIGGVPIDVEEREFELIEEPPAAFRGVAKIDLKTRAIPSTSFNPLRGGISISKSGFPDSWGTLGIPLVQGSQIGFLTCQHVAAGGSSQGNLVAEDSVVQPPNLDGDSIGIVNATNKQRDSWLDAAIILSNGRRPAISRIWWGDQGYLDVTIGDGIAQSGQQVFQVGAASGKTVGLGRVKDISAHVKVSNSIEMFEQILVEPEDLALPIIRPGDSGAVLLERVSKNRVNVVGLVHAKSNQGELIACHWSLIKSRFGVRLSGTV